MKVLPFTIPVPYDHSIIVQEEVLPHFYTCLHRHAEVQITWIQEGAGTLLAGNSMHPFHSDEIYLLGANLPHLFKSDAAYFQPDNGMEVKATTIFFNPSGKLQALFSLPEMKALNTFVSQWQSGFKVPDASFGSIAGKITILQQASGPVQLSLFIELISTLSLDAGLEPLSSATHSYSMSDPEGMRIAAVYNYIMQNYAGKLSLEAAAAQAHLTPTAFCRYFKKYTRHTFVHFVNKIRVNEACKMLTNRSTNSMASVAYACGFNSITNFNYIFKSITGHSPSQYLSSYTAAVKGE